MTNERRHRQRRPAVRRLGSHERDRIRQHLLALDDADRAVRFGTAAGDDAIARYVETLDFGRDTLLGVRAPGGALLGLAHVALAGGTAELGLSVSAGARSRGLGRALAEAALAEAIRCGASEFRFDCSAANAGMRALAAHLGMPVVDDGGHSVARLPLRAPDTQVQNFQKT
jgi:GNAT superfamily N-acetyltransferase